MNIATKEFKLYALAQCGGTVLKTVKANELLSDEHIVAGFQEMGLRGHLTPQQDVWPNPLVVCLDPSALKLWLHEWQKSPGSPVSQGYLQTCRNAMGEFLLRKSEAGFVAVPINAANHWTALLLILQASGSNQTEPNKIELLYKDSMKETSASCLAQATLALSFLVQAVGANELAQQSLPACSPSCKQTDCHSCVFFCLLFIEEQYRVWRGEGRRALPEKFQDKAKDLMKFCTSLMTVHYKELKKEAVAKGCPCSTSSG